MCKHKTVLAIYTDTTHTKISHYRCPCCGKIDTEPFGIKVITITLPKCPKCYSEHYEIKNVSDQFPDGYPEMEGNCRDCGFQDHW